MLQDSSLSRGCFTSSRMVWDLGIILNFSLVHLNYHWVMLELLEDNPSLGREDCNVFIFGFPCSVVGYDFMSLCQLD
jgi:hypothetical protein